MKNINKEINRFNQLSRSYEAKTEDIMSQDEIETVVLLRKIWTALTDLDDTIASNRILKEEISKLENYVDRLTEKEGSINIKYLE